MLDSPAARCRQPPEALPPLEAVTQPSLEAHFGLFFAGIFPFAGVCDAKSAFPLGGTFPAPSSALEGVKERPIAPRSSALHAHVCAAGFVTFYALKTAGKSSLDRQNTPCRSTASCKRQRAGQCGGRVPGNGKVQGPGAAQPAWEEGSVL